MAREQGRGPVLDRGRAAGALELEHAQVAIRRHVSRFRRIPRFFVLGMARSGMAVSALLARDGKRVAVFDDDAAALDKFRASDVARAYRAHRSGRRRPAPRRRPRTCDCVVVSPGVPLEHPVLHARAPRGVPVIGEIEAAYHYTRARIVGRNRYQRQVDDGRRRRRHPEIRRHRRGGGRQRRDRRSRMYCANAIPIPGARAVELSARHHRPIPRRCRRTLERHAGPSRSLSPFVRRVRGVQGAHSSIAPVRRRTTSTTRRTRWRRGWRQSHRGPAVPFSSAAPSRSGRVLRGRRHGADMERGTRDVVVRRGEFTAGRRAQSRERDGIDRGRDPVRSAARRDP